MSEPISELIHRYRALPFPSDHLGDCPANHQKVEILPRLDEHANEPEVSQLLLDILSTKEEYDLARIEAIKIIRLFVTNASSLEQQLKGQIWRIFGDPDDDYLVRQHASQNVCVGFGGDAEHEVINRVLFDDDEDEDVRHGAFQYLKETNDTDFVKRLIPRLSEHPFWRQYETSLDSLTEE